MSGQVKFYYIYEERYDWLRDVKNFEKIYHAFRSRIFLKKLFKVAGLSWILDAGCGTGLITIHAPQPVIGLDINLWNLKKLQKRLKDKELIQADVENLPFRDNCLGLIICTEVLEHLSSPEKAVREFYRILKNNGVLIGTVPSIHPLWRFRKYLLTTCPSIRAIPQELCKEGAKEHTKDIPGEKGQLHYTWVESLL